MGENIERCNAYCDPDKGIHATVGYGGRMRVGWPCNAGLHGLQGRAEVLLFEEAVEVPPPDDPELIEAHNSEGGGPWLILLRFPTGT